MLCTLLAPTVGRATVAGHDLAGHPERVRLHIGAALQEAALDPVQSGRELLRLQARLYGLPRTHVDQRVDELASLVDLGDALDRPIGTYSGGMRRRLDLAVALVHHPDILFLDEPTTGLDPTSRTKVWDEVRRLNEELGMTIFLTTQYLEEADALADRIGIINDGRIVAEGTPEELKRRVGRDVILARVEGDVESAREALLDVVGADSVDVTDDGGVQIETANGGATIGPAAIALGRAGITITGLTLRSTTLDDVFLELTGSRIESIASTDDPAGDGASRPPSTPADQATHTQENHR